VTCIRTWKPNRALRLPKRNGHYRTDEKVDVEKDRLNQLSTALVRSRPAPRQPLRQRHVSSGITIPPRSLQNPLIASLKNSLSEAEAQQADAAGRLGKITRTTKLRSRGRGSAERIGRHCKNCGLAPQHGALDLRRERSAARAVEAPKERVLELKHQPRPVGGLENDVLQCSHDSIEESAPSAK